MFGRSLELIAECGLCLVSMCFLTARGLDTRGRMPQLPAR